MSVRCRCAVSMGSRTTASVDCVLRIVRPEEMFKSDTEELAVSTWYCIVSCRIVSE